jgi:spore germination protein KC
MAKKFLITLLLISFLLLGGCLDSTQVGDTIVVLAHGWDTDGKTKLFSAQMALTPPREGEMETGPKFMVVSERAPSFAEAARNLSLSLPRLPLWSMADTIVIGEELARLNTNLFTDIATRNPRIRYNVLLFVAKGTTPSEIFQVEVPPEDYSGTALERIIENQTGQAGIYFPMNMKDFLFKTSTSGVEPSLPQIILEGRGDQTKLKIQGMAVFKGCQMVGSLNEQQSRGLALLKPGAIKRTIFNIKQPGTDGPGILSDNIAIELTSYQVKAKPSIKGKDIVMNISIKAKGNIIEDNSNHNTDEPQIAKAIEQAAAQALRRDIESCINQAQALNSDIMGWGLSISRSHPELWQEIEGDWPEIFAGIPSNIKVEFKLIQTYLQKDVFPLR